MNKKKEQEKKQGKNRSKYFKLLSKSKKYFLSEINNAKNITNPFTSN